MSQLKIFIVRGHIITFVYVSEKALRHQTQEVEKLENREQDLLDSHQAEEVRRQHSNVVRASNRTMDKGHFSTVEVVPRLWNRADLSTRLSLNVTNRTIQRWSAARMSILRMGRAMTPAEREERRRNKALGLKQAKKIVPANVSADILLPRPDLTIRRDIQYATSQPTVPSPVMSSTVVQDTLQASPTFDSGITASSSGVPPVAPVISFPSAEQVVRGQVANSNTTRKVVQQVRAVSEDNSASITSDTVFSRPQSIVLQTSSATASAPSTSRIASSTPKSPLRSSVPHRNNRPIVGGKRSITWMESNNDAQDVSEDTTNLRSKYYWFQNN